MVRGFIALSAIKPTILRWLLIALICGFLLFLIILLPVFYYEYINSQAIDISLGAVAEGALINISETRLFNQNFNINRHPDKSFFLTSKNKLGIEGHKIPMHSKVEFYPVWQYFPEYMEPIRLVITFPVEYDTIMQKHLTTLSQREQETNQHIFNSYFESISDMDTMMVETRKYPYFLGSNLYTFQYATDSKAYAKISTTIFSTKLFLMHKAYVCYIYRILPECFQPDWFRKI